MILLPPRSTRTYTPFPDPTLVRSYVAIIGLALDLRLRERYKRSLDDYMRHMWQRNGAAQVDYAPAKPYTPEDLQAGLAELTGDPAFAKDRKSTRLNSSH